MTAARTGALAVGQGAACRAARAWTRKDDRRGQTALMWAAAEGHAAVVAGADRRPARTSGPASPSGFTPLLFAVREGRLDVVRVLLKAGADVNETMPVDGRDGAATAAGCRRPARRRCSSRSGTRTSSWRRRCSTRAPIRTPICPGYTVLHAITAVRKPGVGDNDPAPEGSGSVTSIELVKKLVAQRRERERADDEEGRT